MSLPPRAAMRPASTRLLARVPSDWQELPLKRIAEVIPSNVDKKSVEGEDRVRLCNYTDVYYNERIDSGLPFMEATATASQIARLGLRAGDVIITKDSETADDIARAAYVPATLPGVVCGYHLSIVRPSQEVLGEFLKYFFDSMVTRAEVATLANGLTRVALGLGDIGNLTVALPPTSEQAEIVEFLNSETAMIDALIAEQERLISTLQEKRQAIISHAVTKGLDPKAPAKQSGVEWIGEIPAHWQVRTLRRVISTALQYGASEASDQSEPNWPRFVRITDLTSDGKLRDDTFRSLPPDVAQDFLLNVGDVLFSRSGATVGKAAMCLEDWGVCCYAGYLIRAVVDRRQMDPRWLVLFTQTAAYWGYVNANQIQATIPNLSAERLAGLPLPVPSVAEQAEIVEHLDRLLQDLDAAIQGCARSIELLRERRTALITAAVTGQIDVRGLVETAA